MDNLNELLKEAKPLYLKRKRNRKITAFASGLCSCAVAAFFLVNGLSATQNTLYDVWSDEVYQAQNGSIIEDMGLPVDDYGLLWIG